MDTDGRYSKVSSGRWWQVRTIRNPHLLFRTTMAESRDIIPSRCSPRGIIISLLRANVLRRRSILFITISQSSDGIALCFLTSRSLYTRLGIVIETGITDAFYWGWLIEQRVQAFVIEKYIEISIGMSINTDIVYADPDSCSLSVMIRYNRKYDRKHVQIFTAKDITKKLILVCSSSWRLQKTTIEIYL